MMTTEVIPAKKWREMENIEILGSIETAIRTLKDRKLSDSEKKYAAELAKDLINLTS